MSLHQDTIKSLKYRKERAETGQINCIPFPIKHLRTKFPGIEQSTYLVVTGGSKTGKTQISNYLILYNSIIYAYTHPNEVRVKFLYFPLEESKDIIILRFISYVLYVKYKVRISPLELNSTNRERPLPSEVLALIESPEMQSIVNFFESCVEFYEGANNSVSISITVDNYAKKHGKLVEGKETFYDEDSGEWKHYIDHYEPDDPDEYVFVYLDHINLINPTNKEGTMLNAITNVSKNMVRFKNRYKYIAVVLQQQTDSETNSLEAVKNNNILATKAALKDGKVTGQDLTLLFGVSNPGSFQNINEWRGYDLNKFKRKYFRVFQLIMNRFGEGDVIVPMYFDGATNYYQPLPGAGETARLEEFYQLIQQNELS